MSRWGVAAVALVVLVGAALGVWLAGESGALAVPGAEPLALDDATPAALDTVAYRGRPVTASLDGVVDRVGAGGTVWVRTDGGTFPLTFSTDPGLEAEDRLLAVGRLRGRVGDRRIEVEAWSRVDPAGR
jgi:hypothetical protein